MLLCLHRDDSVFLISITAGHAYVHGGWKALEEKANKFAVQILPSERYPLL